MQLRDALPEDKGSRQLHIKDMHCGLLQATVWYKNLHLNLEGGSQGWCVGGTLLACCHTINMILNRWDS
jgi:hypothetical protein